MILDRAEVMRIANQYLRETAGPQHMFAVNAPHVHALILGIAGALEPELAATRARLDRIEKILREKVV